MKVVVFGANGKVGSIVTDTLLQAGHEVRAFVHKASSLHDHPNLETVEGDIYEAQQVQDAIQGMDAVISTLGSWGTPKKDILTVGMRHIIPAMQLHGTRRIISLTGAEARAYGDKLSPLHRLNHFAIGLLAGKVLKDGELHIQLLEDTDFDWTVIRSPIMKSSGSPKTFTLSLRRPQAWQRINRAAVATAIVSQLADKQHIQQAPFIVQR